LEEVMATKPKPKPEPPEPDEPEPNPDVNDAAPEGAGPTIADRIDAILASQADLIERVEKLEERINAPPIGLGRRP
jgi:hypothetical protein